MSFEEIRNFEYEEEKRWFEKISITKDEAVKKKLKELVVIAYMPLAQKIARNLARRSNDPVEDITQVGSIGLIKAVNNYDTDSRASFKTYATCYITGEIRHYLRDRAKLVKVPREIYELTYRVNNFIRELTEKTGEAPADEDIANEMNLTSIEVQEARTVERRITPISMNVIADDELPISLEEKIGDENYEELFENFENKIMLNDAISILNDDERTIIRMNFFDGRNQREISQELDLSKMQVSRTIKRALRKMFEHISDTGEYNG